MSRIFAAMVCVVWLVFSVSLAPAGEEGQGAEQPVELGRQFGAMPWLADLGDAPFEVVKYDSLPVSRIIPARAAFYEIDPDVVASAYSYFFYVRGIGQDYVAGSVINLAKLCHELGVLEEIKERNKGKEVAIGLGEGLKGIGTGLGNLIIHPGLSLKSVGTRVRQTGRSLERAVGAEDKVGRDATGDNRSHLGSGPAGAERRGLAYQLGVDVYTSNPVMRDALVELSQLRTAGGLATWAIPYHIGSLAYLNPIHGDEKTEQLIRDFEPYELRRLVGKELEPIVGMGREDESQPLYRLLMNPNYTPRGIAYIGLDLMFMRDVGNLRGVLEVLAAADSPEEADMQGLELRLYSFFHRRIRPLARFLPYNNLFAAIGSDDVFYFMFFGDTIRPWQHTAAAFDKMLSEAVRVRARDMEIWSIGDVNPAMMKNAAARGVTVRQNVLRDPQFFPAPEQRSR